MRKIIFATKNGGKFREVKKLFDSTDIELISLNDFDNIPDIDENGNTFIENATIKAMEIYKLFKRPVIADDSGLSVEALNGAPGVVSARYAGKDASDKENNYKLLKELEKFEEPYKAKFICASVYYNGKELISACGEMHGKIIKEASGGNGFGYDPLFVPNGYDLTNGELELSEKNKISHRAKAFNKLIKKII
ncbi:MAG: non-canonical purine NTP pyrophosphatase, RdgB/HAM1 family [Ignavibacteria bacterium CG2_30_36_16]|nr:MAG: non-canonical purine NTP pyrophosphatase, RdgB/HAM1 family [Ignavibacteria bacterium CG2_30_36_16]